MDEIGKFDRAHSEAQNEGLQYRKFENLHIHIGHESVFE